MELHDLDKHTHKAWSINTIKNRELLCNSTHETTAEEETTLSHSTPIDSLSLCVRARAPVGVSECRVI